MEFPETEGGRELGHRCANDADLGEGRGDVGHSTGFEVCSVVLGLKADGQFNFFPKLKEF